MKKTPNTSQLGTGTPTPLVDKGNIITAMDLETATKILERALKTPSSRTVNAVKTNIREIESLARNSRSLPPFGVSAIATHFGGVGHAQASGFTLSIDRFFGEVWRR